MKSHTKTLILNTLAGKTANSVKPLYLFISKIKSEHLRN